MSSLLEINNLTVAFSTDAGELTAVRGVSLAVNAGETLALVGESGCGKTVLCKTVLQLLCRKGLVKEGEIRFEGENLLALSEKEMERRRGKGMAMVFQDPMLSLNPTISVGEQIAEVLRLHGRRDSGAKWSRREAAAGACSLMEQVGISQAESRYGQMPHHFSGGMRQRIAIAIALAGNPKLLLADEPTTALDVETQGEILKLLKEIQNKRQLAIIFITHDLSLVSDIAKRVVIMKDGVVVEEGSVARVFSQPKAEYTKKLLLYLDYGKGTGHRGDTGAFREEKLISIRKLYKSFPLNRKLHIPVLENVNMELYRGEILGLVGPSGCGKSTLAKCIMEICTPSAGQIFYHNGNRGQSGSLIWKQMIFQDSASAFNPRMTVEQIIGEPLRILRGRYPQRDFILELLEQVELLPDVLSRYPYEISGGQRQRAAIARAISTNPELIVADEPISSLDISVQSQIVHLFRTLQEERGLTLLLIAHDLPMVRHVSHRIITL